MLTTSLARVLTLAAERYPDAEAVVDGDRRATYRAFDARVNRMAQALLRLGLRKGDHVVLLLKIREEHVVVYWACQKIGAIATPLNWRQVFEAFRPHVFLNHLGSTEVYTFTVCHRVLEKPTCAGRAGLFGRVRIVRADPERQGSPHDVVPRGETGELIVGLDSPEAFAGYWRRPDADARAIRDGWYFTGDLAYEDADGDIFTVGRVDDMIISGGENIYPIEVEEVLLRHPSVADVGVAGLPDPRWGQVVTAFVVVRRGSDGAPLSLAAEELDAFCQAAKEFAGFKRPRRYELVDALPRSPTGKLLRRKLLEAR